MVARRQLRSKMMNIVATNSFQNFLNLSSVSLDNKYNSKVKIGKNKLAKNIIKILMKTIVPTVKFLLIYLTSPIHVIFKIV